MRSRMTTLNHYLHKYTKSEGGKASCTKKKPPRQIARNAIAIETPGIISLHLNQSISF